MIAAVDVHYNADAGATVLAAIVAVAAAVVFSDFADLVAYRTYTRIISSVEDYAPGQFYKRELPCIMAVLETIEEDIDTVIIDGYVELGKRPGLGLHLWKALKGKKKVIGVAKSHFKGSSAIEVYRRGSRRPLYVTAIGIDAPAAADLVSRMSGEHRLPTLLKLADSLSKNVVGSGWGKERP